MGGGGVELRHVEASKIKDETYRLLSALKDSQIWNLLSNCVFLLVV
jgi:hypothetical protein